MRKTMVVGNWKMNGCTASVTALVNKFVLLRQSGEAGRRVVPVFCPASIHVSQVKVLLSCDSDILIGGQNASSDLSGAFTGEVSPRMLVDLGCKYVVLGHSERRQLFNESDAEVARKFKAAQSVGLVPILCVGETRQDRDEGKAFAVIQRQLAAVIDLCGVTAFAEAVVAYEPIWAIGTGLTASVDQVQGVHRDIREWIFRQDSLVAQGLQILYGGSVKPDNAKALFASEDVDGGLVGGASLDAVDFAAICKAAG